MSLAAVLGLLVLVVLALLSQGYFIPVMVVTAVMFGLMLIHYLAWGWWLGAMIRRDVEREEQEAAARDTAP
jgi:hypothetical protein